MKSMKFGQRKSLTPFPAVEVRTKSIIPSWVLSFLVCVTVSPLAVVVTNWFYTSPVRVVPLAVVRAADAYCKPHYGAREVWSLPVRNRFTFVCNDGTQLPNAVMNIVPPKLGASSTIKF